MAPLLVDLAGKSDRHIEPFLGSGSYFFLTKSTNALLGDINSELINCYRVVRDEPDSLIAQLKSKKVCRDHYLDIRQSSPSNSVARAVRFLYLNRTAFNGIYRVNQGGRFNVPFGCRPNTILCNSEEILLCSKRLSNVQLYHDDFERLFERIRHNDTIYIDPPYTIKHNDHTFQRYNERPFTWNDQLRLASLANKYAKSDIRIIISNAFNDDVIALYSSDYFSGFVLDRPTNIAARSSARGRTKEILLVSVRLVRERPNLSDIVSRRFPDRSIRLEMA